jgi:hypothetical protein
MAPRTSSRSERLFWRLSVIGGNMCSESYGDGRTEIFGTSGIRTLRDPDPTAEREIRTEELQPILQGR